jgi:hypothetical protein
MFLDYYHRLLVLLGHKIGAFEPLPEGGRILNRYDAETG